MITILMSIGAEHNANIESGKKTAELRTRIPKAKPPFKVLTYESGKNGRHKVTNEWICREIEHLTERDCFEGMDEISNSRIEEISCVDIDYILRYKGAKEYIHAMHISDLVIYDEPRELSEFKKFCNRYFDCDGSDSCEYYIDRNCYEFDDSGCSCEGIKPITRPPQSWCYVESEECI